MTCSDAIKYFEELPAVRAKEFALIDKTNSKTRGWGDYWLAHQAMVVENVSLILDDILVFKLL